MNKLPVAFLLLCASAIAQPTITPSSVTVAPGATQQFATSATHPMWLMGNPYVMGASIGRNTGVFKAPMLPPGMTSETAYVIVYDTDNGYKMAQATITITNAVASSNCGVCPPGRDGKDGKDGRDGKDAVGGSGSGSSVSYGLVLPRPDNTVVWVRILPPPLKFPSSCADVNNGGPLPAMAIDLKGNYWYFCNGDLEWVRVEFRKN